MMGPLAAQRSIAALFAYQVLVRYNYRKGCENGQIRWIIDSL